MLWPLTDARTNQQEEHINQPADNSRFSAALAKQNQNGKEGNKERTKAQGTGTGHKKTRDTVGQKDTHDINNNNTVNSNSNSNNSSSGSSTAQPFYR